MTLKATVSAQELQIALSKIRSLGSLVEKNSLSLRVEDPELCLSSVGPSASIRVRCLSLPDEETRSGEASISHEELGKFLTGVDGNVEIKEGGTSIGFSSSGRGAFSKLRVPKQQSTGSSVSLLVRDPSGPFDLPSKAVESLTSVCIACPLDFDRPSKAIQTYVAIRSDGHTLSLEAHEDFFMSIYREPYAGGGPFLALIPGRVAKILSKLGITSLTLSNDLTVLSGTGVELELPTMPQKTADLQGVLDSIQEGGKWVIPKPKVRDYIGLMQQAMVTGKTTGRLGLDLAPGTLSVYVSSKERGSSKAIIEDPGYTGNSMKVALHGPHLIGALRCLDSDVEVKFSGPGELVQISSGNLTYVAVLDYA